MQDNASFGLKPSIRSNLLIDTENTRNGKHSHLLKFTISYRMLSLYVLILYLKHFINKNGELLSVCECAVETLGRWFWAYWCLCRFILTNFIQLMLRSLVRRGGLSMPPKATTFICLLKSISRKRNIQNHLFDCWRFWTYVYFTNSPTVKIVHHSGANGNGWQWRFRLSAINSTGDSSDRSNSTRIDPDMDSRRRLILRPIKMRSLSSSWTKLLKMRSNLDRRQYY